MNWTDALASINSGNFLRRTSAWDMARRVRMVEGKLSMVVDSSDNRPGLTVQWSASQPDQDATDWEIQ